MFSENNFRSSFHYVLLCVPLCIMCVYQIVILTLCSRAQVLWECAGDQRVPYSSVTRISPTILGLGYVQVFRECFFLQFRFFSSS